jgi:dienelactone hydrolase
MPKRNTLKNTWLIAGLLLTPVSAFSAEIAERFSNGLTLLAEYREGDPQKPAVLVVHGFLQTHRFSTVQLINNELAEAGYSVLSPTLSLNISARKNSLTCDAIQNHTVAQASEEIAFWIDWLKRSGHSRLLLVGHSTGSNRLLSYLQNHPDPAVAALIATAVGPIENWRYPHESQQQLKQAKAEQSRGDTTLGHYTLSFCHKNYTAPTSGYLSYMQWRSEWLIEAMQKSPVPLTVVLGGSDKWLPPDWAERLDKAALNTVSIPEANHYFSGIGEFEFQAAILSLVQQATASMEP